MEAHHHRDDRPTIGVDAVELGRYIDSSTEDGGRLLYDDECEDAWMQSDVYYPRATCV